jgi:hypothetical protein
MEAIPGAYAQRIRLKVKGAQRPLSSFLRGTHPLTGDLAEAQRGAGQQEEGKEMFHALYLTLSYDYP